MAYPILHTLDAVASGSTTAQVSKLITMPSNLASGDLIVVIWHCQDNGGIPTVNLSTNLGAFTRFQSGGLSGSTNRYGIFWKWSDGTESGQTVTVSHSTGATIGKSLALCYRISGCDQAKTPTFGFTPFTYDSPPVTAPWGGGENLFVSFTSYVNGSNPIISYPTGYSNGTSENNTSIGVIAQATKQSTSATDDAPAYTTTFGGIIRNFGLALVVGSGSPATIDSINGGNPVKVGQTGIPIALSNFISTPTSVTCTYAGGTKSLTVSNIVGNNTAITVDLEDRSEGVDYPLLGSALEFTVTDGVGTDAISTTVAEKTGETDVTFQYAIDQYPEFFAYHFNNDGFTSEGSEFIYTTSGFSPDDFVLRADSGFSSTSGGVVTGWLRPATGTGAGNVYSYTWNISEAGISPANNNLTSVGLTSVGLTNAGLTRVGL